MTDHKQGLQKRRDHRGVLYIGTGVMCAVAVTLAGCTGASKKTGPFAGAGEKKLLEAEQAKLAKSERALKAAARKLAVALSANKAKDRKLRVAQRATRKYRAELQAADKDIADLETRLAEAEASQAETAEGQSGDRPSEQEIEALKARLDKSIKERDVLKAQLDEVQKQAAKPAAGMSVATSQQENQETQQNVDPDSPRELAVVEKPGPKQNCERVLHQAAELDKQLSQSRAEREKLNGKLLASLDKMESISVQHAQEQRAAALEVKTLRSQLAEAKQQIADARAEAGSTTSNQCKDR